MKPKVVLSLEQSLAMTYATLRCVHLGWRVIKLEQTPVPGRKSKGDPNRYVGRPVAGEDRHSYFIAQNLGKEAIAIDLKQRKGQDLLRRLISGLEVDVFCANTIPMRHAQLGIDYATLCRAREDLIWCSVSALGSAHPEVPGYDPVIQAMCGYMDVTGEEGGPPMQCGVPLVDLKAGDEAFTQIVLALMERCETGRGRRIDISMAQAAASWLQTFIPMLDMGSPPAELKRRGNEHRQFVPVNVYQTADSYIYMALGSDAQWLRLVQTSAFADLAEERYATNAGRRADRVALHARIGTIVRRHTTGEITAILADASIPASAIKPIEQVSSLPFLAPAMLKTRTPDGRAVRIPPAAVGTEHLERLENTLPFAPAYGEHTDALLAEIGLSGTEIARLREEKVVA